MAVKNRELEPIRSFCSIVMMFTVDEIKVTISIPE
jgi:hypothetical protein